MEPEQLLTHQEEWLREVGRLFLANLAYQEIKLISESVEMGYFLGTEYSEYSLLVNYREINYRILWNGESFFLLYTVGNRIEHIFFKSLINLFDYLLGDFFDAKRAIINE